MSAIETESDAGSWPESVAENITFVADTNFSMVGAGERPDECGTWYPSEFCSTCGEPHFSPARCELRRCPSCWINWTRRRAESITRRLGAARYDGEGIEKRCVHVVVSPPENEVRTIQQVKDGYRDAYSLARDHGIRGGVAILHPWRVKKSVIEEFRETDTDGGLWRFVREHDHHWRELTYWSPHWHIIGLSTDVKANSPELDDGWVVHRVRSLERFGLTDSSGYEDMAGLTRYLLSHAGFEAGESDPLVRWFGSLSTAMFSPEAVLSHGSLSTIERYAHEAAFGRIEDGEGDVDSGGEGDIQRCERDGCEGALKPIWDAGDALRDSSWTNSIERDTERRLRAAFEWSIGERKPPPDDAPRTENEAREYLDALVAL